MSRRQQQLIITLSLLVFCLMIAVAFQPVIYHLQAKTIIDDGYYYLGYAQNIAEGKGATFDGVITTNGVQPLWAICLSILAFFVKGQAELLQAGFLIAIMFLIPSYWLMVQIVRRFFQGKILYLTLIFHLSLIGAPSLFLNGMESSVILFTFTLAVWTMLHIQAFSYIHTFIAGWILSLVFLARIDLLIMTPTFALILIWSNGTLKNRDWRKAIQSVVMLALPCVIVFAGYVFFNLTTYGIPLPVSGMVKSALYSNQLAESGGHFTISHLLELLSALIAQLGIIFNYYFTTLLMTFSTITIITRFVLVLGFITILIAIYHARYQIILKIRQPSSGYRLHRIVALLIFLNLVFHSGTQMFVTGANNTSVLTWYHVQWYIMITFGVGFILKWFSHIVKERVISGIQVWATLSLIISMVFFVRTFQVSEGIQPFVAFYDAVQWANDNIPDEDFIGSFNSGLVGYFTENTVINLDGLMNNTEMLELIREGGSYVSYADTYDIRWLMDYQIDATKPIGNSFRHFPVDSLDFQYEMPFLNFGFYQSKYIVAEINLDRVTSPEN